MKFTKGNKVGVGLKTPESRQAAYESYCDHIGRGLSKWGWFYLDADRNHCKWETMEKIIKDGAFDPFLMSIAEAHSFGIWEKRGIRMVDGGKDVINCSPRTWETIMRNKFKKKYGWDAEEEAQDKSYVVQVINYADDKEDHPA